MRQERNRQMNIFHGSFKNDIGKELKVMSQILDETPEFLNRVYHDLQALKSLRVLLIRPFNRFLRCKRQGKTIPVSR